MLPPLTICTLRPLELRQRCADAGIPARLLLPQRGEDEPIPRLPACESPYLLDTVDMPPLLVATLLVQIERQQGGYDQAARCNLNTVVGAILAERDLIARRLAALTPAVRMLVGEDLSWDELLPFQRNLSNLRLITPIVAVGILPVLRPALPRYFLSVLAALPYAASSTEVAARCGLSMQTVRRTMAAAREVLELPEGRHKHYTPPALAEALVGALARPDIAVTRGRARIVQPSHDETTTQPGGTP